LGVAVKRNFHQSTRKASAISAEPRGRITVCLDGSWGRTQKIRFWSWPGGAVL